MRRASISVLAALVTVAGLLVAAVGGAAPAVAATLPAGFVDEVVAGGLSAATAMAFAPDGRLFVAQQFGELRVVQTDGSVNPTPFLALYVDDSGERGLLGVAFDPAFTSNRFVYVYYTVPGSPSHNRISRFTASGDVAVPGSEVVLADLDDLSTAPNHNGGSLHFGPDGALYVSVGENANPSNAQTLANRLGKILRINPDGSIPPDNPFAATASGANRSIWALGLRNPYTFAFEPGTGRMFINDVGQASFEEIDEGVPGANYGWPITEGVTSNPAFRSPLLAYAHGTTDSTGCAITGGTFYRPSVATFPDAYVGRYFYSDYCGGWIRSFDPATMTSDAFFSGASIPVGLQVGPDGALYYVGRGDGAVHAIRYGAAPVAAGIATQPADVTVSVGVAATFGAGVSGSGPFAYQWQRDGVDIPGATDGTYTVSSPQLVDDGAHFRVRVANAAATVLSADATLHVTPRVAPSVSILAPPTYAAGEELHLTGIGTDVADGALAPENYRWTVVFHHDEHTHPFSGPTTGMTQMSFTVPVEGETSTNVWFEVILTVQNSAGLTSTATQEIRPRIGLIQLRSVQPDAEFVVDGQPVASPAGAYDVWGVVGMHRSIAAQPAIIRPGQLWGFRAWSDAGPIQRTATIPVGFVTLTSSYGLDRTWSSGIVRRLRRRRIRPA